MAKKRKPKYTSKGKPKGKRMSKPKKGPTMMGLQNPIAQMFNQVMGGFLNAMNVEKHEPVEAVKADWWFDRLKLLDHETLRKIGLGRVEGELYLYPEEWYESIPEGYTVEGANGEIVEFSTTKTTREAPLGFLPYGFRKQSAYDSFEKFDFNASIAQ